MAVSGDASGNSTACNGITLMLDNGSLSSDEATCDGGTILRANYEVGGTEPGNTSVGGISVMLFALSMFDVKDGEIIVVTLNNGGFNSTVTVVTLVVSRVITVTGVFLLFCCNWDCGGVSCCSFWSTCKECRTTRW